MSEWAYKSMVNFYVKVLNEVRTNPGKTASEIGASIQSAAHVVDRVLMQLENRHGSIKSKTLEGKDRWGHYLTEEFQNTLTEAPVVFEDYEAFTKNK